MSSSSAWNAPGPLHCRRACCRRAVCRGVSALALIGGFRSLAASRVSVCAQDRDRSRSASPRRRAALLPRVWAPLCLAASTRRRSGPRRQRLRPCAACRIRRHARDSDLLVPAVDLSACFPDAAARYIAARGGSVRSGIAVRAIDEAGSWPSRSGSGATRTRSPRPSSPSDRISSPRLSATARPAERPGARRSRRSPAFTYESITTIYLGFCASRAVQRAHAAPRRCARAMGVRPQRSAGAAPAPARARRA